MVTRDIIQRLLGIINDTRSRLNTLEAKEVALLTATQTLTNKTLTTPTIGDYTNAQHAHTNAASGGTISHNSLTNLTTGDPHTQYLLESAYDANTILKADADNTPIALTVGASTIVGRASTGNIAALTAAQVATIVQGSIDHGSIAGLTDDDHTGYARLAGRSGGQTLIGGTAANDDLTLEGTSNATRTTSYVILQPTAGNVGIGTTNPTSQLTINSSFATISGLTISGENAYDSQIITRKAASKTAFSVLAWESQVYLGAGIYYDNGVFVHHNSNNNNQLFTLEPGNGVRWFASNNALSSWNQAIDVTLWDDQGDWNSLVQSTRTGNSYFTGGNVGIGTTSPETLLTVSGSGYFTTDFRNSHSSGASIYCTSTAPGGLQWQLVATADGNGFGGGKFSIAKGDGTSSYLTIVQSSGNVGIGTTSPDTRLDIDAGAIEFAEMTAPAAGAANTGRLFCRDNGSGKTQLCVIFNTGAIQVIATQP